MRYPVGIPLMVRNIIVSGPAGDLSVDLMLDTGAVFTVLSWTDLRLIGYDPATVPGRRNIVTANGVIQVPTLRVARMSVGPLQAQEAEVICHDIPELAGVRGLLGLSFLRYFRTVIDYRRGYLEIV